MANSLTYPTPALESVDTLTTEQIHELLRNQPALAWRVRTLAAQRFIADSLLTSKYQVVGGSFLYETGEPLFSEDDPEVIAAGGEYPRSQVYTGDLGVARTEKLGRDIPITDESIKRRGIDPVTKAFNQLVNRMVKFVDGQALSLITSKVTQTQASTGQWGATDADAAVASIVESVELVKAKAEESGEGHTLDTIALSPTAYAKVMSRFLAAGLLPREASNPLLTGTWPTVLDLTWLRSPNVPSANPLILDTAELGGMADEQLGGPGYVGSQAGIETKSIREEKTDSYLLRARRVTVPVITDATAGYVITGTGL